MKIYNLQFKIEIKDATNEETTTGRDEISDL